MRSLVLTALILLPGLAFAGESQVVIAVGYMPTVPPVRIQARADYVAVPITIQSDAKDALKRIDQVEQALRTISDRSKQHSDFAIRSGVVSLSPRDAPKSFGSSYEAPGSSVHLYVLAMLKPEATVFALTKRIHQMLAAPLPETVRLIVGTTTLGMNEPERFRPQLLGMIAKSVTDARKVLGGNGLVEVDGLENPVGVMQLNESEVLLFVNHHVRIQIRNDVR